MTDLVKIDSGELAEMDDSLLDSLLNEASGVKSNIKFKNILFKAKNGEFLVETDELDDDDKKVYKEVKSPIVQFLKVRKKIQNKIEDDTFYSNEFDGDRATIIGKDKEVIAEDCNIWSILVKTGKNNHLKERFSMVTVVYVYAKFELEGKMQEGYFKMYLSYTQEKSLTKHIERLNGKALALYPVTLGLGERLKANQGEETRPATPTELEKYNKALSENKVPGANIFYALKVSMLKVEGGGQLQADKQKTIVRVKNVLEYIEAIKAIIASKEGSKPEEAKPEEVNLADALNSNTEDAPVDGEVIKPGEEKTFDEEDKKEVKGDVAPF